MRLIAAAAMVFMLSSAAHAACNVPQPPAFSTQPSLGTMTSDQAKVVGGCVDGTPIGQNNPAPGNFSSLTINGVAVGEQVLPTSCTGLPDGALYNNNGIPAICTSAPAGNAIALHSGGCIALHSGGCIALR